MDSSNPTSSNSNESPKPDNGASIPRQPLHQNFQQAASPNIPMNPGMRRMNTPLNSNYLMFPRSNSAMHVGTPPPVPARVNSNYLQHRYNRYGGGMYMPYSRFSSGMYGSYGMHYPPYQNGTCNNFIQMAEENSRPAFEAIESVVEVVSSISMMVESTYHAVHSSYSAILGVVDQFSRLKDHLTQFLSILAVLRALRWLCFKILYVLKLRKENPSAENIWDKVVAGNSQDIGGIPSDPKRSTLPFILFMSIVIGAPWLMLKLLSKAVPKKTANSEESKNSYVGITTHNYTANKKDELSFNSREVLYIHQKSIHNNFTGWYFATNVRGENGYVPANYMQIKLLTDKNIALLGQQSLLRQAAKNNSMQEGDKLVSEFNQPSTSASDVPLVSENVFPSNNKSDVPVKTD